MQAAAGRRSAAVQAVADARAEAESAIGAERERVAAIQDICAGEFPRIERDAIRRGWDVEETSQKVLKAMRESRPQADLQHLGQPRPGPRLRHQALEAALCLRAGIDDESLVTSDYGEQVVREALRGDRDI